MIVPQPFVRICSFCLSVPERSVPLGMGAAVSPG
jgi:hypothetical protein